MAGIYHVHRPEGAGRESDEMADKLRIDSYIKVLRSE